MSARARHRKQHKVRPLAVAGVPASLAVAAVVVPMVPGSPASASVTTPGRVPGSGLTASPAVRTVAETQAVTSYTVREGDTLSSIAQRFYGSAQQWPALWFVNKIADPNVIETGQVLRIDTSVTDTASIMRAAQRAIPAPPPAAAPVAQAPAAPVSTVSDTVSGNVNPADFTGFEQCVITRESGGDPRAVNPSSDAGGLYQFLPSTWAKLGFAAEYPGGAQTAPVSVQEAAFQKEYAESGTSAWGPYDGC
jgi:LysM repeat protein